jgi:hypothetical protein
VSTSAQIVAWVCFGLGIAILLTGARIGLGLSSAKAKKGFSAKDAQAKVEDASTKVQELKTSAMASALSTTSDSRAAAASGKGADEVKGTLEDISSILSALPENLRFAGLLILIGTVLMSVATVQFGGHSLF